MASVTSKGSDDSWKGIAMTVFGASVISTDAVLLRFSTKYGASIPLIFFWKYFVNSIVAFFFVFFYLGKELSWMQIYEAHRRAKWHMVVGSFVACALGASFTVMFIETAAADAILLASLSSLWAALFGWLFLGEILAMRTRVALVVAIAGVCCIFLPLGGGNSHEGDSQKSTVHGNIIAVGAGLFTALYVTIQRHGSRIRGSFMPATTVYGVLISTVVGLCWSLADVAPSSVDPRFYYIIVLNGLASGVINIVVAVAPRFIPGPEVTLILLLETILAPFFVFLGFGETPGYGTLVGGAILLVTLSVHGVLSLRAANEDSKPASGTGDVENGANSDSQEDAKEPIAKDGAVGASSDARGSSGRVDSNGEGIAMVAVGA